MAFKKLADYEVGKYVRKMTPPEGLLFKIEAEIIERLQAEDRIPKGTVIATVNLDIVFDVQGTAEELERPLYDIRAKEWRINIMSGILGKNKGSENLPEKPE